SYWFGPIGAAGLETFVSAGLVTQFVRSWEKGERSAFRATSQNEVPQRLRTASYEGVSPWNSEVTGIPAEPPPLFAPDFTGEGQT
ncbi:MAG: hypothetical protein ACFCD0_28665, partial [Gemmataceae bacterium]